MARYYVLALLVILIDQFTKWLIMTKMDIYEQIPIIDQFFYITSHRNSGAAWGILQGQMIFFYIITILVIVGIVYYMQRYARNFTLLAIGLGLVLGGAIGNFIDRLVHKEVVDFLDFMIFSYNYPIFNVADAALVIGVICIGVATLFEERLTGKKMK